MLRSKSIRNNNKYIYNNVKYYSFKLDSNKIDDKYNDIRNIKNKEDLKKFYLFYNKKNLNDIFNDYDYLINSNLRNKCSKNEVVECFKIIKYIANTASLIHFFNLKNNINENNKINNKNEYKNINNNIYYIHNIEREKINKEDFIKNKEDSKCLKYFLENNLYKFISKIKKCDIWNYKEKNVNKNFTNYFMIFPIMSINIKNNHPHYSYDFNVFFNYIHKNNKNIFIDIVKKINYKMLNSQELNNLLITLTILHHNNKSLCIDNNNNNVSKNSYNFEIIQKNKNSENVQKNKDYINKKTFIDIFNNIYKSIYSKINTISFLYLYDYILLMCINEIKNREAYIGIINRLSNYMNVINKISNKNNQSNENDETFYNENYSSNLISDNSRWNYQINLDDDINKYVTDDHINGKKKKENIASKNYTYCNEIGNEVSNETFNNKENMNNCLHENEKINEENSNFLVYESNNFQLSKKNYLYIKNNLHTIKNSVISKILLIYIMKYVFSHIDNNILYAHSDLICENLELIHHYLVTNFIFTIGTCKYIDEFCMFMLAKYVQNNINTYTPNEITVIVNTYADASLEDVSFYETICDHIKLNFKKFSSIDIIKTIYAFSKVRIRDEDLLKMSYKKINSYLEEREKKFDINKHLKDFDLKNVKNYSSNLLKNSNYNINNLYKKDNFLINKQIIKKNKYIINKYLCAYAVIAAGKLDYFDELDKLFIHLKESIKNDGIDIRGILWMPIAITSFLSFECIFHFLPIYINLIYNAFRKTQSTKLLSLLIRRHSILLHTIETDIIPKKYIDKNTLNNLYFICKSKKDTTKEKVFIPDSSTFHIEVSNALLSLDIPHKKEVNIYPFTIDIFIKTSENCNAKTLPDDINYDHQILQNDNKKKYIRNYNEDTNFEQTFETKKVKNKAKNKNEVYTDIPFL
ncbi:conserved Plasmodium protein, unknown function [Plasmodium gallinaceum]|uniref:Uncharacterized protein n=1 Tax=Plasmodium gallinaceum TaxID=5849 RepID=A0A1J1H0I0_PLAGA|nr:conserved Plasmodium protein, unknown function [Plasmodium gallinaceum]CRG96789.1 conserved Plasmodium protein, unknown function [Plasmodium gallinaceum]